MPPAKRQPIPAICRNACETGAKSRETRTSYRRPLCREVPANRPVLDATAARHKIVVSPVRVRVSPSAKGLQTGGSCRVLRGLRRQEKAGNQRGGLGHIAPSPGRPETVRRRPRGLVGRSPSGCTWATARRGGWKARSPSTCNVSPTSVPGDARAVAWLHEALEWTAVTEQELLIAGVTLDELRALRLLSRTADSHSDRRYLAHLFELIACATGHSGRLTRIVKTADLKG